MEKGQLMTFIVIASVIVALLYGQLGQGQSAGRGNRRRRPGNARRRVQGMNPHLHQAYLQALNQPTTPPTTTPAPTTTTTAPNLAAFGRIPQVPTADETECFVEIETCKIEEKPGVCVRGGGIRSRPFMCQSGIYLQHSSSCQQIIANRNADRPAGND